MVKKKPEISIPDEVVLNRIYVIRGEKVMIDKDLAELYAVETKQLKRQVRRNINRFPEDFMFELSKEELEILRSQFGTSSWGGSRYVSDGLYRTGRSNVVKYSEQSYSNQGQHTDHAPIHADAENDAYTSGYSYPVGPDAPGDGRTG